MHVREGGEMFGGPAFGWPVFGTRAKHDERNPGVERETVRDTRTGSFRSDSSRGAGNCSE